MFGLVRNGMTTPVLASETSADGPLPSPAPPSGGKKVGVAPNWVRVLVTVVLGLASLMVAGNVFSSLASFKQAPPRDEPEPPVLRVEVFNVERTDLKQYVWAFGTAEADKAVVVSAEVSGRVTEAENLEVGNRLSGGSITIQQDGTSQRHPGDIIVQIDPQTYQERVSQADSAIEQDSIALDRLDQDHSTNQKLLAQQQRRLKTIQDEFDRNLRLLNEGGGTQAAVDRSQLELEQYRETQIRLEKDVALYPIQRQELETRQAAHRNDLRLAELELDKATVRTPFSGILSEVFVEEGQYVRPGDRLVEVTDVDTIEIAVPLSLGAARTIERLLAEGQAPRAQLAANEDQFHGARTNELWVGRVRRLDPIADVRTRTVHAFIEVENRDQPYPLRPGTFVYARIEAGIHSGEDGFLIPRDALVNNRVYLATKPNMTSDETDNVRAEERSVEVARTYQTFALISEGLTSEDRIVMTNLDIVADGTLLEIRTAHTLDDELQRLRVPYLERLHDDPQATPD